MTGRSAMAVPPGAGRDRKFLTGLARAFGASVLFSLPLLMTMEMWSLGFSMDRLRLAAFMLLMIPLLVALDHYSGFQETTSWTEDAVDGMVAYGVGIATSALILAVFHVIGRETGVREMVGMVALQAVPASFGAVLAASQLGGAEDGRRESREERRKEGAGYGAELLFMLAGAVFLAFNVAPTEEMILIAFKMTYGHALVLAALSLVLMHGFVYSVEFRGTPSAPPGTPGWSLFLRFTVVGYAISLGVSAYVLWTFGRFDGDGAAMKVMETLVLAFPASIGAAAARLVL